MTGWLLRLYPRRWRERYGVEFQALLDDEGVGLRVVVDVLLHAARAQAREHQRVASILRSVVACGVAEVFAVRHGYSVNLLWVPRSPISLFVLCIVVLSLGSIIATALGVLAGPLRRARARR